MKDPSAIYDAAWFVKDFDHPGVREDFHRIADSLVRQFRPKYVFDYGCGPGFILERLHEHGVYVCGFEGSVHGIAHAPESVRDCIEHVDLTTMEPNRRVMDEGGLVICTEVAEHLEAEHAPHLVELLCAHMCPIVFTAAPPGQGGHDHVNEQPQEYWAKLFGERGAICNGTETMELVARWARCVKQLGHMTRNVQVYF